MPKKTINTLVEDIYKTIGALSEGKPLDISEENYEEFGKAMADALRHWSIPQDRNGKANLRMSNIGRPQRRLWYDMNSESEDQEPVQKNAPGGEAHAQVQAPEHHSGHGLPRG